MPKELEGRVKIQNYIIDSGTFKEPKKENILPPFLGEVKNNRPAFP